MLNNVIVNNEVAHCGQSPVARELDPAAQRVTYCVWKVWGGVENSQDYSRVARSHNMIPGHSWP